MNNEVRGISYTFVFSRDVKINNIRCVVSVKVRVVRSQYKEDGMVKRRRGEASSFGQADAYSVEDHCSHHRTYCCPVPGAL